MENERLKMLKQICEIAGILYPYLLNPIYAERSPFVENPLLSSQLNKIQFDVSLYGKNDEIEAVSCFVKALIEKDIKKLETAWNILMPMALNRFRIENGLEPLPIVQKTVKKAKNVIPFKK